MLLPPALGFSPHPPVSVYGTGTVQTIAAFLGTHSSHFGTILPYDSPPQVAWRFFQPYPYLAYPALSIRGSALCMRPHISVILRYGNLNPLSIGYAFRPLLRSRLTRGRSALPRKPWIFGRKDSHLALATHSGILSSHKSTAPFGTASSLWQCSPTNPSYDVFLSFGGAFEPRTFSAQELSTSELLRTLGMYGCF